MSVLSGGPWTLGANGLFISVCNSVCMCLCCMHGSDTYKNAYKVVLVVIFIVFVCVLNLLGFTCNV